MLIDINYLNDKYKMKIRGIMHIGAHNCEEMEKYNKIGVKKENIIWIEANPYIVQKMKQQDKEIRIIHGLITDKNDDDMLFNVANNGQSSSIYEFGTHSMNHPEVRYVGKIILKSKRMDRVYEENKIEKKFANFLNIDIQGAELLALKGMGDLIKEYDYLYLEVNSEEVYMGCGLITEIDIYLEKYNFKRVETKWWGNAGWGDAFYIRN